MNLRWLKQNLVLIIAGLVFVGLLTVIILLERTASEKKDTIAAQLAEQDSQLRRLRELEPTPSPENIDAVKHEREQLQMLYRQLQTGAIREPVPVPELQ